MFIVYPAPSIVPEKVESFVAKVGLLIVMLFVKTMLAVGLLLTVEMKVAPSEISIASALIGLENSELLPDKEKLVNKKIKKIVRKRVRKIFPIICLLFKELLSLINI